MNQTDAINQLVEFVEAKSDWDDELATEHLVKSGASQAVADDAVRFTGVAFGRLILVELGVELSNKYILFRGDGSTVQTGELDQNEGFRIAVQRAGDLRQRPGFKPLAYSSPEMDGVNQALEAGANPTDLVLGPVALFVEPPTRAGMQIAEAQITRLAREAAGLSTEATSPPSTGQWWKFW